MTCMDWFALVRRVSAAIAFDGALIDFAAGVAAIAVVILTVAAVITVILAMYDDIGDMNNLLE